MGRTILVLATISAVSWAEGRVRVGYGNFEPFNYRTAAGEPAGFQIDVMRLAAQRAGLQVEWVHDRHGMKPCLADGRCDLWMPASVESGSDPGVHVTTPWWGLLRAYVVLKTSAAQSLEQLNAVRLAVVSNPNLIRSAGIDTPRAAVVLVADRGQLLPAICSGAAEAAYDSAQALIAALLARPDSCGAAQFRLIASSAPTPMAIGARPESAAVAERLREAIHDLAKEGEIGRVAGRYAMQADWASYEAESRHTLEQRRIWGYAGVAILAVLLLAGIVVIIRLSVANRTVRQALERAQRSDRLKGEFLSIVSHEIRTPLNGVIGMTGLLLDTPLSEQQRGFAEKVRLSGEILLGLVNDVLDLSKAEAGMVALESVPFDLREAAADVLDVVAPRAFEKRLTLVLRYLPGTPRIFHGDPGRVRQILLNLVSNAVKFTISGHVLVTAGAIARDGGTWVQISVEDTGCGIPADKRALLFRPFQQLDASTTRQHGGTGLGLAITRQLVLLMRGTLELTSRAGGGSVFRVEVPLEAAPPPPELAAPAPALQRVRVLIADPNPLSRGAARDLCGRWEMRAEEAASWAEALEKLTQATRHADPYPLLLLGEMVKDEGVADPAGELDRWPAPQRPRLVQVQSWPPGEGPGGTSTPSRVTVPQPLRESRLRSAFEALLQPAAAANDGRSPVSSPALAHAGEFAGCRILVVEDNFINQQVMSRMLAKLGCSVDVAANGQEAVEMARQLPYALIFMDCQMPVMDGFAATEAIRHLEQGAGVPIVAVTASATLDDRERCLRSGMNDFLSKPVSAATLVAMLQIWLPRRAPV